MQNEDKKEKKANKNVKIYLIPLSEAAKLSNYTAEHLNLMCRKGILRGKKVGRNWHTTKEWLDEFLLSPKADNGKKYQRRKKTTLETLSPEELSLISGNTIDQAMQELIGLEPEAVPVNIAKGDEEDLKYLLKEKEREVEELEHLHVQAKFGIVKIVQSLFATIIITLLIFSGTNIFQKVFDRLTIPEKNIDADLSNDTFLTVDEKGIVLAEQTTADIAAAQKYGVVLASENFRAQEVSVGGDVILATSDESAPLEISDMKSESFVTKKGDEAKIMITWKTNKLAVSDLEYSKGSGQTPKIISEPNYSFNHVAVLSQLEPKTSYVYSVNAKDKWANQQKTGYFGIYTSAKPVSVFDMIAKALGETFGWINKQ